MPPGASTPRGTEPSPADENRLETARLDALSPPIASPDHENRRIARRLLVSGQPDKAVAELIRFSRERPMTARMASALVALALATKKTGPIQTVVTQGTDEAEGRERVGVLRALARLQRRSGQEEAAVETLAALLAEAQEDRRSRLVLNALLERFERWEALDASLDKEARLLLRRRYFRAASRVTLRRARLWGERLGEHARAALRFGQAAQYAEQGQDPHSSFLVRLLWLRALVHAEAPTRSIDEGMGVVLDAAERVGREARARAFIRELGLRLPASRAPVETSPSPAPSATAPDLPAVIAHPSSTLADQEAVEAEPAPTGQAGEALLVAAASAPSASPDALRKLEARYIARGAWRELARFYRETAGGRVDPKERASWLEKVAELLESELDDAAGAAKVWEEVARLTGDSQAVSEQVRILDEQKDEAGVRQALDSSVVRAQDPAEKARLLVLRANEALGRGDVETASRDYDEALRASPGSLEAAAGLAELGLRRRDVGALRTFERLLAVAPKNLSERPALFRRLARVADAFKDGRVASNAWSEVLAGVPHDEEALARLWVLSKGHRDDVLLERVLRDVLAKDPRGELARAAWMDLVTLLERRARFDEGIAALREAVKAEPGHLEAWLSLVDRLLARKLDDEAAWALEHAATSAPEGPQRVSLWRRLARHARERLSDEDRAEKYEDRIDRAKAEPPPRVAPAQPAPAPSPQPAVLPGGPLMVPPPRASRPKPPVLAEPSTTVTDEEESEAFARALGASLEDEDARPPAPLGLPPRLQRVIIPVLEDFTKKLSAADAPAKSAPAAPSVSVSDETREAPADEFADDDDIDEVLSQEAPVGAGPPSKPAPAEPARAPVAPGLSKEPSSGRMHSIPTRPAPAEPARAPVAPGLSKEPSSGRMHSIPARPAPAEPVRAPGAPGLSKEPSSGRMLSLPARPAPVEPARAPGARGLSPEPSSGRMLSIPARSAPVEPPARAAPEEEDETPAPEPAIEPPIAPPPPSRPRRRRTQEIQASSTGDPVVPVAPSGPSPAKQLTDERRALFEHVRANPLEPDGYRMLAEHFDTANDASRSSLMLELARALEGDPNAAPRTPKLILSATDRAGLRHPFIRTEGGELVTLASPALCRLFPAKGKDALTTEEFTLESGKGAKPAADALLASVRLLGMRAPDVFVSDEAGPPFSVLQTSPPRLVVNRLALKKPVPDPELRFYAGRALFTLSAELLALRTLKRDQLKAGVEAVGQMLKGQVSTEAKLLRAAIPAKTFERLKALWPKASRSIDYSALMEGARHSVNRAGLVVCGGIAPAISSLRAKKALPVEVTELVRFAASERYLQLRNRKLGKK